VSPTASKAQASTDERDVRTLRADARRNRRSVLEAARRRFASEGLEAQIDDIAHDAKVGVGTVYRHFPTKEELLEALADLHFTALADLAKAALEDPDPDRAFRTFIRDCAALVAADRALAEALGQLPGVCGRAAARSELNLLTAEVVERAQAAGALRRDIVAGDVAALMCGVGTTTQPGPEKPWMAWERYVEILLAGLMVTDAPPLPGPVPSLPGN
jgi:AcrR family transcriptional regulator